MWRRNKFTKLFHRCKATAVRAKLLLNIRSWGQKCLVANWTRSCLAIATVFCSYTADKIFSTKDAFNMILSLSKTPTDCLAMQRFMFRFRNKLEVFWSVIGFVPIYVVNYLVFFWPSTDFQAHDVSVFVDISKLICLWVVGQPYLDITIPVLRFAARPSGMFFASLVHEIFLEFRMAFNSVFSMALIRAKDIALDLTRPAPQCLSTNSAFNLLLTHSNNSISRYYMFINRDHEQR